MRIKLEPKAIMPKYSREGDSCMDIFSPSNFEWTMNKGFHTCLIDTGISVAVPRNHVLLIFSRSGQGFNHDIRLSNCIGVIDENYRGTIKVKLTEDRITLDSPDGIKPEQAIAQMLLLENPRIYLKQVTELDKTNRGSNGFGSSDSRNHS